MKLTKKEVDHIANLARLELTEVELKKYSEQLSKILGYIELLNEVDTTNIEPTAQVTGLNNVLRNDEIEVWDKDEIREALDQAPDAEDNQIKVKRVLN